MSPEFGESQTYPRTFEGGVFSPVIAPWQDGVHVDLKLSSAASELPNMHRVMAYRLHPVGNPKRKV
jgi:hypothetical protein